MSAQLSVYWYNSTTVNDLLLWEDVAIYCGKVLKKSPVKINCVVMNALITVGFHKHVTNMSLLLVHVVFILTF